MDHVEVAGTDLLVVLHNPDKFGARCRSKTETLTLQIGYWT